MRCISSKCYDGFTVHIVGEGDEIVVLATPPARGWRGGPAGAGRKVSDVLKISLGYCSQHDTVAWVLTGGLSPRPVSCRRAWGPSAAGHNVLGGEGSFKGHLIHYVDVVSGAVLQWVWAAVLSHL